MIEDTLRETQSLSLGGLGYLWDDCDASILKMVDADYKGLGTYMYGSRTLQTSHSMKMLNEVTSSKRFEIKKAVQMFVLLKSLLASMTDRIEAAAPERQQLIKKLLKKEEENKKLLQENKELRIELSKEQTNAEHISKLEAKIDELETVIVMLKKEGFKEGSKENKEEKHGKRSMFGL
tara:strand:+ start:7621 stop:8154 length:534 start_codon:yes stop_codon:yes gene_type:complete